MPKAHKIIILGGGFAGVGVAKRLLKLRDKNDDNHHKGPQNKAEYHTRNTT